MERDPYEQGELLEQKVRERTQELEIARLEVLERLVKAAEYRDDNTHQHAMRIGETSALIAAEMGLDANLVEQLKLAAPLHDVGKIAIPDSILLKHGRLSLEERATMESHAAIGARILSESRSDLLRLAEVIARCHHERWDGAGYPAGLAGEDIPLVACIVAVADVFDALTHDRPYKDAWPLDQALEEIVAESGGHFDPAVVTAFEAIDHHTLVPAQQPAVLISA